MLWILIFHIFSNYYQNLCPDTLVYIVNTIFIIANTVFIVSISGIYTWITLVLFAGALSHVMTNFTNLTLVKELRLSDFAEDKQYLYYNSKFGIEPEYYNYTQFYVVLLVCLVIAAVLILVSARLELFYNLNLVQSGFRIY